MDCTKITKKLIAAGCSRPVIGVENEVILMNFDDIDKSKSKVQDNIISFINIKNHGIIFKTIGKSLNDAGVTFAKGIYRGTWSHSIPLRTFIKNEKIKEFVNKFGNNTRVMAIIKNKEHGKENRIKYEVFGWDNGLELTEAFSTIAMTDGIVYNMILASSGTQETSLPKSVYSGSPEATESLINYIITPKNELQKCNITKYGINGEVTPTSWSYPAEILICDTIINSDAFDFNCSINGVTYTKDSIAGIILPAGEKLIINDMTIRAGNNQGNIKLNFIQL